MKKYTIEQSGRSMIEMLGVLAIVGVLSVAGIAGYSKAMAKYKTNKLIDQISTIAANVKTKFVAQGNYKGIDTKTAYQLGIFPEEMVKDCSDTKCDNAVNAFSGRTILGIGQAVESPGEGKGAEDDDKSFSIYVDGMPKDACFALLTADWGSSSGFVGFLNNASYDDIYNPAVEGSISTSNAYCSSFSQDGIYALNMIFK